MALFNAATDEKGWAAALSFLSRPPYPLPSPSFLKLPFEERVKQAGEVTAAAGLFPAYPYLYHVTRAGLFLAIPWFYLDVGADVASLDEPFKKLVLWALLLEICGFSTMSGPLGGGGQLLDPLWFRTTPGTLKQPLLPFLPRTRSVVDVSLFVLFVGTAFHIFAQPAPGLAAFRTACGLLTALCLSDRTAFTGAMGAYYYPLLFCLCFDEW